MAAEPGNTPPSASDELEIPLAGVAKFARQLSHDVRNHLGSMDLQAAYIAELIEEPEAVAELKKLRAMIMGAARSIQNVSSNFSASKPNVLILEVGILFQDFQERLLKMFPDDAPKISWSVELGTQEVAVDLEMMFASFAELCRNAFYFHEGPQPIEGRVCSEGRRFVFELRQGRAVLDSPPEQWGVKPLVSTRRGGYGLGLFHVRGMLEANGGELSFEHDLEAAVLTTRVVLPLAQEPENGG